jgi:hypothetical protein
MAEWHELVIDGTDQAVRAFVLGFVAGAGGRTGVVFGRDVPLEAASLGERVKSLFHGGAPQIVLVPPPLAESLAEALDARGASAGVRLVRRRTIAEASMAFRVETYSREDAQRIRASLLESLPDGVRAEKSSEAEEIHPEAKGPEPFAPLHAYSYRVAGRIVGSMTGVLQVWERVRERDFIEIDRLELLEKP